MKKRTISAIILMALIIATFSIFAMPASADVNPDVEPMPIIPGCFISTSELYSEFELTSHEAGETYIFPLYIFDSSIIQTFGTNRQAILTLLDSEGNDILDGICNTYENGYGRNSLVYYGSSDACSLSVHTLTSAPIRISVTAVDNLYGLNFYDCFEDIPLANSMSVDIRIHRNATVFRYIPSQGGDFTIHTEGNDYMEVYFIDPSSTDCYSLMALIGENESEPLTLQANKTYYVVMYIPLELYEGGSLPGDTGTEVPTMTVAIS